MVKSIGATLVVWSIVSSSPASAQSIRDLTASGKPVDVRIEVEYPDSDVPGLASKADLVIVGRVEAARPVLTRDAQSINTDISVVLEKVVTARTSAGQRPTVDSSKPSPSMAEPIVVRVPGGEMDLNGQHARVVYADLPTSDIQIGSRYVFFLKTSPDGVSHFLAGGTSGMFLISDGRVTPAGKHFRDLHPELGALLLSDFLGRISPQH